MKRAITPSLFHRAMFVLLIAAFFSFLGERQYLSKVISIKPGNDSPSPQNERIMLSPSEVAKLYWKASTAGTFHETRRYIDFCSLNSKYSVDREIIKTLASLIPRSIYESSETPDAKSGESIVGGITDAKIDQAINEISVGNHIYVPTSAMRQALSAYYVTQFKNNFQELSEQYIAHNDNGTTSSAAGGNNRQRSEEDNYKAAVYIIVRFLGDFAGFERFGKAPVGTFVTVKGPHGHKRKRLSRDHAVKMLEHVQLRAELHAASAFLAANPKRSKPENLSSSPKGELVIGKFEEESLKGDTASVVAIIHFRDYPVTRSRFELKRCKGEWKIVDINLFYKDVLDLRKDLRKKENKNENKKENRKIAFLPYENYPVFRIPAAMPLIVKSVA